MVKEVERKTSKRWGLWTWSEDEKGWDDWRNDQRWNSSSDWNECATEETWEKRRALSRGIPQAPFPRMSENDAPQRRLVNLSGKSTAVTTAGSGAPTVVFEASLLILRLHLLDHGLLMPVAPTSEDKKQELKVQARFAST